MTLPDPATAAIDPVDADARDGGSFRDLLATRLLRIIFGTYFLVTLVVTSVQLVAEYRHAGEHLDRDIDAMQQTFGPAITDALWRFNTEVLGNILAGMNALPTVIGVKVVDAQGQLVVASGTVQDAQGKRMQASFAGGVKVTGGGEGIFDRMFSRSFDVVYTDENGRKQPIGRWTIYSSRAIILKQVEYGFMLILVNSVIKTLALWFIFLYVIHRTLGKPLKQLADFVGQLDVTRLGKQSLVLTDARGYELQLLASKLNQMIQAVRRSVDENRRLMQNLEQMNQSLESQVAERTMELLKLATTDPLTTLYNRRKLDEVVNYEIERVQRYGGALSLIIGDIDRFKDINDTYGHPVGDLILVGAADVLRIGRRVADTVGRWGGEEFMIVCPQTDLAGAASLAESLRQQMGEFSFPHVRQVTCSFGVAQLRANDTAQSLTARADLALYGAKANGRNRVEVET
jgi:diguanylate cyclase (GGDEF)-like protein